MNRFFVLCFILKFSTTLIIFSAIFLLYFIFLREYQVYIGIKLSKIFLPCNNDIRYYCYILYLIVN